MFGLRFTSEFQNLSRNGHPHHSTTGEASRNSTPFFTPGARCRPNASPNIESASSGSENAAPTQSRFHIDSYSGSACSSVVISIGSSAMPQIVHVPGPMDITTEEQADPEYESMWKRLWVGAAFSLPLLALSMFGEALGLQDRKSTR